MNIKSILINSTEVDFDVGEISVAISILKRFLKEENEQNGIRNLHMDIFII